MGDGRVEIDRLVISSLLALRNKLGSARKAVEHLNARGTTLTVNEFHNIRRALSSGHRRFIESGDYRIITGTDPETTFEDRTSFIRKMVRWYTYFTPGTPRPKLAKIAEELRLGKETLYRLPLRGRVTHFKNAPVESYSSVESYFLNWYLQEGFQNKQEVCNFLDEMERLTHEFPIFDRVPREQIDELITEISETSDIPLSSIWPTGYSKKNPSPKKTFPFSDYWRLAGIRDEVKRRHLTDRLYGVIDGSPYGSIISCILPFIVQLKDEFGFGYSTTVHGLGKRFKGIKQLGYREFRENFEKDLVKELEDYLSVMRRNKGNGFTIDFDPATIERRVSEATRGTLEKISLFGRGYRRAKAYE